MGGSQLSSSGCTAVFFLGILVFNPVPFLQTGTSSCRCRGRGRDGSQVFRHVFLEIGMILLARMSILLVFPEAKSLEQRSLYGARRTW